jgi:alkylation response protein AidB-like acyl-CoA dehydrogenase
VATAERSVLAQARALGPLLRESGDRAERARRLDPDVVAAMVEAGLFRMLVPRALGGLEVDPPTLLRVVEEVSSQDGSAGWCLAACALNGQFAAVLPEASAAAIWSDPGAVVEITVGPTGRAVAVRDGYRLTGRWRFASGCEFSTWHGGLAAVYDGDAPRLDGAGDPETRWMFLPMADCRIVDAWDVAGLRATGSHEVEVEDVFVPEARTCGFRDPPRLPERLFRVCQENVAPALAAVPLGIARAALDDLIDLAQVKTPSGAAPLLRDRAAVQIEVGRAEARLRAARALLFASVEAVWRTTLADQPLDERARTELRLASVHAAAEAAAVVDAAWRLAGASAIFAASPIERRFRDLHTATQNGLLSAEFYQGAGAHFLDRRAAADV